MKPKTAAMERGLGLGSLAISASAVGLLVIATIVGLFHIRPLIARHSPAEALLLFFPLLLVLAVAMTDECRRHGYSIHLLHLLSLYVLLVVGPMYQVVYGQFPLQRFWRPETNEILRVNAIIVIWLFMYCIGYYSGRNHYTRKQDGLLWRRLVEPVSATRIRVNMLLTLPAFAVLVALGMGGVVTRGAAVEALAESGAGAQQVLIVRHCLRSYPVIVLGSALLMLRRQRLLQYPFAAMLAFGVFLGVMYAANPVSGARYWTVAVLVGLLAPQLLRRSTGVFAIVGTVAALGVFPALGVMRQMDTASEAMRELSWQAIPSPPEYLAQSMDVGSYSVLKLAVQWVDKNGHTYGRQLLGALLFWVPRFVWPDKPIATGQLVSRGFDFDFTVISAPVMADPFVDFGWFGVPILALLVGVLASYLDAVYFSDRQDGPSPTGTGVRRIDTFYPFVVGLVPLLTRGSMMIAFGYLVAFVVAALPLCAFVLPEGRARVPGNAVVQKRDSASL